MTRPSKREIETDLDELTDTDDSTENVLMVWEHPETGAWFDATGDREGPLDRATVDPVMVLEVAHDTRTPTDGGTA